MPVLSAVWRLPPNFGKRFTKIGVFNGCLKHFLGFTLRKKRKPNMQDSQKQSAHDNYKWFLLFFLWSAFFLHQGTRQIFNAVIPQIQNTFGVDSVKMGACSRLPTEYVPRFRDWRGISFRES